MSAKVKNTLLRLFLFLFVLSVLFYISRVLLFLVIWLIGFFAPTPEGLDPYRDAAQIAFERIPEIEEMEPYALGIGIVGGLLVSVFVRINGVGPKLTSRKAPSSSAGRHPPAPARRHPPARQNHPGQSDEDAPFVVFEKAKPKKPRVDVWEKNEDDWFDARLEDYDHEDGYNVEFQEEEADLE